MLTESLQIAFMAKVMGRHFLDGTGRTMKWNVQILEPVEEVFVDEVHLWVCGHMDLDLGVVPLSSQVLNCPFLTARPHIYTSQNCWLSLQSHHVTRKLLNTITIQ